MKTPTEMLISALENDMDDIDKVLIIRIHKSRGISFEVNTGCRMDAYALANVVSAYTLADVIKDGIKEDA
jgi:hypothetical protein